MMTQTTIKKHHFQTHFSFKSLLLKGLKAFERKMVAALQRKNHWLSGSLNRWWVGSLNAGGSIGWTPFIRIPVCGERRNGTLCRYSIIISGGICINDGQG